MKHNFGLLAASAFLSALLFVGRAQAKPAPAPGSTNASVTLLSPAFEPAVDLDGARALQIDRLFLETARGRVTLPGSVTLRAKEKDSPLVRQVALGEGHVVTLTLTPEHGAFTLRLTAQPSGDILKWGLSFDALEDEYFTGLMERVVDGPQQASWAKGRSEALDLRGQKVDMILKPTLSVYAPFYLSSRGYAAFVKGNWPGQFDFCASDLSRVKVEFEGPAFEMKVYASSDPAALVSQHALDAGPPFQPPAWMYGTWRWRDEHTQRTNYFDGTPVTGPFNAEVMEDVLMMKAFGIPCSVYWLDRPWGPGALGYDDFEIDSNRFPNFPRMVKWLNNQDVKTLLWIGPFFQGKMAEEGLAKHYNLAGQTRPSNGNNYPLVDFSNPAAKAYWQAGVAKLLQQGVAAFKLDRGEENIPDGGPFQIHDGRTLRENRNAYPSMYLKATYDVAREIRGDDFVAMPRAASTGSAAYGVFWGGDIGGVPEGLRAEIIGVQRAAVMGYPNWGSDTCGYTQATLDHDLCARWLEFSCFTPIMEVGPTRNVAFWNLPREPRYDAELIAAWRLYARLHTRLAGYSHAQAEVAHRTGMPIVRPLILIDPKAPEARTNWWTYQYGPDLLVSPIWETGRRSQEVYLPSGASWRNAWHPDQVLQGGQTVTVRAELHQVPLFVRLGSEIDLGDLKKEWQESVAITANKPDLRALDADLKKWFDSQAAAK